MDTINAFLFKIRTVFSIFKNGRVGFPSSLIPSCAHVSMVECVSISLNMPKCPWKLLNKLLWLCQGSEYAWLSYMFDRNLKMTPVLNKPAFWIWHGCICKGCAEFRICLIMDPCSSTMPEFALMFLNMPEHGWILLNVLERTSKCRNNLFWLCQSS